ncbi:MAG: S8/S53 family peptidase [Deltaproteobacteria bacterium]|nr:S8/S53 family peptidase [Deltaproteobacteria bacterium]
MHIAPLLLALGAAATPARANLPAAPRDLPAGAVSHRASSAEPMYMTLSLTLADHAGLEQLLRDQQDPASPQYRRFLTPQEFGERFGQSAQRYDALAAYLREAGLQVETYPNRLFIRTLGTVARFEKLLGVTMFDAELASEHLRFMTFQSQPTLPTAYASMVQAVGGLDTRFRPHHRIADSQGNATFGPDDFRAFYDMTAVHNAGSTGTHAKAAMLGTYPDSSVAYRKTDITSFYSQYAHATTQLVEDKVDPGNQNDYDNQQGLDVEESMDAELPVVAAPGLASETMILVGASELFSTGIQHAVNSHSDINAISVSFGGCEGVVQQSDVTAADDAFAQGAAEGQAWFLASGDDGVTGCARSSGDTSPSSGFPSDSPHVVAVGGTMYTGSFNSQNAVTAWGSEKAWNENIQGQTAAGGGGASVFFGHPSWQTGPGTNSSKGREQPDIALLAGLTPGIGILVSSQGGFVGIGNGTSAAAPMAAGIFALVADHAGGCKLGLPNSTLYQLGAAQQSGGAQVFHDITSGNISANGTTGPSAGAGYDEATGWGSIDVAVMVANYPACGVATTSTSTGGTTVGGVTTGATSAGATSTGATSTSTGATSTGATSTSTGGTSGSSGGDMCGVCDASGNGCANASDLCIAESSSSTTGFCAPTCTSDSDCASGATCTQFQDGSGNTYQGCYPSSQTCSGWTGSSSTSAGATSAGATTGLTNGIGGIGSGTGGNASGATTGNTGSTSAGATSAGATSGGTSVGATAGTTAGTTGGSSTGGSGGTGSTVPAGDTCHACRSPADCPHADEQCVTEVDGQAGYCAPACTSDSQCGAANLCTPMTDAQGDQVFGCYPSTLTCRPSSVGVTTGSGSTSTTGGSVGSTGGTGTTGSKSGGGCASTGAGDLAFALVAALGLAIKRRRDR